MVGKYVAVKYHPHARDRMRQRRISPSQVERVIADPDSLAPSATIAGRIVAEQKTATGATLRVVFAEENTADGLVALVLTAVRMGT